MDFPNSARADKYLWAVRLFKTRTVAADACKKGHVKLQGANVKASRGLKKGDVLEVTKNGLTRTVRVVELLEKRVGAKEVEHYLEDLTPEAVYAEAAERKKEERLTQIQTGCRPTKRDRRLMEKLIDKSLSQGFGG